MNGHPPASRHEREPRALNRAAIRLSNGIIVAWGNLASEIGSAVDEGFRSVNGRPELVALTLDKDRARPLPCGPPLLSGSNSWRLNLMDSLPAPHNTMGRGGRHDATGLSTLPRQIGKYNVVDRLGSGAFGVVYRCRDAALERTVAVKVLSTAGPADPGLLERFQRESRAAARISHPHIVPIYEAGLEGDRPYLVMEHVEGQSLDRLIGSPRLTLETAAPGNLPPGPGPPGGPRAGRRAP